MRFTSAFLALPLLASAAEGPFDQYKAQFNNFFDNIGSYIPNPAKAASQVHDVEAKAGGLAVRELTLSNWRKTLYDSVKPGQEKPEEWWVFITGGNKTCYGTFVITSLSLFWLSSLDSLTGKLRPLRTSGKGLERVSGQDRPHSRRTTSGHGQL
jgi:hypothetical protein